MERQFDVVIGRDAEGPYVAPVPRLRGCHSQARSLDEVMERVREAISLCLEVEGRPLADARGSVLAPNRNRKGADLAVRAPA